MYIYIYIERERERDSVYAFLFVFVCVRSGAQGVQLHVCRCVYERERVSVCFRIAEREGSCVCVLALECKLSLLISYRQPLQISRPATKPLPVSDPTVCSRKRERECFRSAE